jgi:hypothetical protein
VRPAARIGVATAIAAAAIGLSTSRGEAHKPITSPYTYNEDVFPLLRDRCGRCHVSGGVAPMSLMTHADTVPWGESIKTELLAGTMPPLNVDTSPGRFRNVEGLTAREMNVLLTWVTGGTPPGDDAKNPPAMKVDTTWRLGQPDLTLDMPAPYTLASDVHDATVEFKLPTRTSERRLLRAVDLRPGTPSIVRWATIAVSASANGVEEVLGVWVPGDPSVPLDDGLAFELPAGAELVLRVHYTKTWEYERKEMVDRSTVGLYFAKEPATVVRKIAAGAAITEDMRALAIYPRGGVANASVSVVAERPDGSRVDLIAFHPRPDWARRYWFAEPISLPRNTKISVTTKPDDEIPLLPLSVSPNTAASSDPTLLQLMLNVVPGR